MLSCATGSHFYDTRLYDARGNFAAFVFVFMIVFVDVAIDIVVLCMKDK